jgi:hypothetical protein
MSEPHLPGHGAFVSAWLEPMYIQRASILRGLTLAKVEALKDLERQWGLIMDPQRSECLKGD